MVAAGFTTLWEFTVLPARQAEFESHYGPEGDWVRLFRQGAGYLGSELLRDRELEGLAVREAALGEYAPAAGG